MGADTATIIVKTKITTNNITKSVWFVIHCQAARNFENWEWFLWYITNTNNIKYTKNRSTATKIAKNIDKYYSSVYGIIRNNLHSGKIIPTNENGIIKAPYPYND